MAEADTVTMGSLFYWCREKHYQQMQKVAQEGLRRFGNDSTLKFFNAYGLILEGDRVQEGMRELEALKDKRDLNLCSIMALISAHKDARSVDREAVQELEMKLKSERKQADEKGLFYAGLFLLLSEKYDKAREYIDRMIKLNPNYKEGNAIKGWNELMNNSENGQKKSMKYFDEALGAGGSKDIIALLGKAKLLEFCHNYAGALDVINQAVVAYPQFVPALLEKMKLQLALQDWEQVTEIANRALMLDSDCLLAHRCLILHMLCREGNYAEAATMLGDLMQIMERVEPKNKQLFYQFSRVFCRMCGRNQLVLQQCYYMQERAVSLDNTNATLLTELGFELLLQGRVRDAMKCYRNAMKQDESSVAALTGVIRCQLIDDQLDDAAQQLEFLHEIQHTIGRPKDLPFLTALLETKRQAAPETVLAHLNEVVDIHFGELKGQPLGVDYFLLLDADFLVQLVHAFLPFAPDRPAGPGQPVNPVLKRCALILEPLTRAIPGLQEAVFLMAQVKYLGGELDAAQGLLQRCLDSDASFSDAHILMAQIHLHQGNYKMANQSLEVGLSYNFEVRDHPLYVLIKARICKKQGDVEEACRVLQAAMSLPGVKHPNARGSAGKKSKTISISVNDRVSVFLELAEAYRLLDQQHEAAKVMQDALNEFRGTPEEIRIGISNADLAVQRDDIEGALAMLRNITPDQPYFVQAREKMAEIYLNHRKDKRLYASCYRELVDKNPNSHTCSLLGDAYMNIQEPEKAIEVYESALKKNPKDAAMASKIGSALVKTHNYGKAINYYEAALKQGGNTFMRHDLAELLVKLRQYDKAEKVLNMALSNNAQDLEALMENSKYYILLAKIQEKRDNMEESNNFLLKAKEIQARVLKRVQVDQPDAIATERDRAASICASMAQQAALQRDFSRAISLYQEALSYKDGDGKLMLELAKLYLTTEDLDSCQQQCMTLLRNDTENDAATLMMADVMFRKNDYEQATYHFKQLLHRRPDNYSALARLVDLLRRAGRLDDVPKFLEMAETNAARAKMDPGFNYCKGLLEWYNGNTSEALKIFNKARKDSEWGPKAVHNMIEICLNPDNEIIGGEVFEAIDLDHGAAAEKAEGEQVAIRTAEKIIAEMRPKAGDIRPQLLENLALVASKNKGNVEKALTSYTELAQIEREHVGVIYGTSVAYMVLKQTPRARNQLKRVAKNIWNIEDAEDLEKCWLLLSDIYVNSGKYDMATELLKRCLQHNKSCCKAYELMGFIMEKEQSFKDASSNYENAWKYGNKNDPNIGYKLAFNYLKAKKHVQAIDVCHMVLTKHPNYPKIRKEILDKARASLRT